MPPLLTYESSRFSLLGTRADLKLGSTGPVSFRVLLRYAIGDGYKADDSPSLRGMEDRKAGSWLGGVATWSNPVADLSLEASGEASGNSKGTQVRLGVQGKFQAGSFEVSPRVTFTWIDKKYVDYCYGVRTAEVLPDRAFYQGRGTTNAEVGVRVNYSFAPRQGLLVDLAATRFGSAIKDSPLVNRSTQTSTRLGYLYLADQVTG